MTKRRKITSRDVLRMMRAVELFEPLSPPDLRRMAGAGEVQRLRRGKLLFKSGDAADRIHLVLDGAIEILRVTPDDADPVPVAYISPGELIGDMALFTGSKRRSSGRVPEHVTVWNLTRDRFLEQAETISGYGMAVAEVFARRLEGFITHMRRQDRRKELSGKLAHFDMPTVVQTLATSNQTGVLSVLDDDGGMVAEVLLLEGSVARARCGPLHGEDAFYEVFLRGDEGDFVFRTVSDPDPETISPHTIDLPAMNLLMEAMRLKDELPKLKERLPDPGVVLKATNGQVPWSDAATADVARSVLRVLQDPRTMGDLSGEIICSTHTLYDVVARLHEAGHVS